MAPHIARPRPLPTALIVLVTALLALVGCGPAGEDLPPAADLLGRSATAMAAVKTAAIDVQVDPALGENMLVRSATGRLTAAGEGSGTATLVQGGAPVSFDFVVTRGSLFLKGPTGRYQQLPLALASSIYDPTAALSPDRGIAALMRSANQGTTEAKEELDGVPTYRVRAKVDPNVLSGVVPGLHGVDSGLVWLDQATSRVVRARLDVPTTPGGPTAPVTVSLSDFDAPVTITPPS